MIKTCCSLILLTLVCCHTLAQQSKLDIRKEIKLRSGAEQLEHTIYIQWPKGKARTAINLPVIILLDAQDRTLFDYTSATIDRLMYTNDIPEAILVGVVQADRTKELSVERNEEFALKFQHFLKTELKALLNTTYQTDGYFTFIGHSLGGQFLTNAMTSDPQYFRSVVSISGALNYPDSYTFYKRKVLTRLQRFLAENQSGSQLRQKYFFSAGSEGYQENGFRTGALSADSLFKRYPNKYLNWKFDYLTSFNHMTTPLQSVPAGLIFIFKDWHFSDSLAMEVLLNGSADPIETINRKKAEIKDSYGASISLPYSAYFQFINFYMERKNLSKARLLCLDFIEQYSDNDETYSLMAEILNREGNRSEALRYYKIAGLKSTPEKYSKEITALMEANN